MAKLILLRHGESQWNLENRFTGSIDVELSVRGIREAARAAAILKHTRIDKMYTSVMRRAIETADIVVSVRKDRVPVERDEALNERSYGDLQGMNKADAARVFGAEQVKLWRRSYDERPPHGESLSDTANRTIPYMVREILPVVKSGKNVLVVAHGNSLRSIYMFLENLSREEVLELNIPTGIPRVYEITSQGAVESVGFLTDGELHDGELQSDESKAHSLSS